MKITSFDNKQNYNLKRDPYQDYLFDLFEKNVVNQNVQLNLYVVSKEQEMRLDKVSNFIYGSPNYVEELMVLNDIISPYSIKEGQSIWYCTLNSLSSLYVHDDMSTYNERLRQKMINSAQPNRNKQNVGTDENLPPTVKPSNLKQITVSKDNRVTIINSFK